MFLRLNNNYIFLLTIFLIFFLSSSLSYAYTITLEGFPNTQEEVTEQEEFLATLMGQEYDVLYGHTGLRDVKEKKSCLNVSVIYSVNKNQYAGVVTLQGVKKYSRKQRTLTFEGRLKNRQIEYESRDGNNLYQIVTPTSNFMFVVYGTNLECRVMIEVHPVSENTLAYMMEHKSKGLLPLPLDEFSNLVAIEEVDTSDFTGGIIVEDDRKGPEIISEDVFLADENDMVQVTGRVLDDSPVRELTIDNDRVAISESGEFASEPLYVSWLGFDIEIVAIDKFGNRNTKTIRLEQPEKEIVKTFPPLNPSKLRNAKMNNDSAALIIGIEKYEWTFDAPFAKNDAKLFHDFAVNVLGVPKENIKTLINDKGRRLSAKRLLKTWLPRMIKPGQTDFYLYFSGHGLATNEGRDLYLLPYDGDPLLIEDSALTRNEIFASIDKHEPNTVIAFLDTCYSGATRSGENLSGARPIVLEVEDQGVPNNFTVFTASANNEIASGLNSARHGLFSYFMMKGLEGEADLDGDHSITTGELHIYLSKNVQKEALLLNREQYPQLIGDASRVLVQW